MSRKTNMTISQSSVCRPLEMFCFTAVVGMVCATTLGCTNGLGNCLVHYHYNVDVPVDIQESRVKIIFTL